MSTESTRRIIDRYTDAWTSGDFEVARTCLADNLTFRGSIDMFDRSDEFIEALRRFSALVTGVDVLQRHYDRSSSALFYVVHTTKAGAVRTGEFFKVEDGLIHEIQLVFDPTELSRVMAP